MVVAVFVVVYAGMVLGDLPPLKVGRTGVALLGAIALLVSEQVTLDRAVHDVDASTLALLFGMMLLSTQLRLGGAYHALTGRVGRAAVGPSGLLALVVALVGVLSSVFTNDIVALAVTPAVIRLCRERELDPVPFVLAVACAANVGAAATLIGNPQNILVGQTLHLHFGQYLARAGVPAGLGLVVVWVVVRLAYGGHWQSPAARAPAPVLEAGATRPDPEPFLPWQSTKGLIVAGLVVVAFLVTSWPRELIALGAAGIVLSGRRFHARQMLGLVDWQLLVLFVGLFIVNGALADSGLAARALAALARGGIDPAQPGWLFALSMALSNVVSNVPAVMLLLPVAQSPTAGAILALSSGLAGNLLLVGSIANLIVVEQAARQGVSIHWRTHARVGIPVTVVTAVLAAVAIAAW